MIFCIFYLTRVKLLSILHYSFITGDHDMYQYKIKTLYASVFLGALLFGINTHTSEDNNNLLKKIKTYYSSFPKGSEYLALSPFPLLLRNFFVNAKMIPLNAPVSGTLTYGSVAFLSAASNLFGRFCIPVISIGLAGKGGYAIYENYYNEPINEITFDVE